jgi:two-component system, LytTR family, response regulator LytT
MKITCLAIDDEPLAVQKIAGYIQKTPFLELVAQCRNSFEAMEILSKNDIQLLFIDINMPEMNGMEFVKSLTVKPYIVFTTAYSEYAVEGFEVNATDYLLKPVSYSNFLRAANKVKDMIGLTLKRESPVSVPTAGHLFVKSEYKLVRIDFDDIKYIESMHEYICFNLATGKPVMTLMSLKSIEEQLPSDRFLRVHRSFIVNLSRISVIERNRIIFDEKVYIPVGEQYKSSLQSYIDQDGRAS